MIRLSLPLLLLAACNGGPAATTGAGGATSTASTTGSTSPTGTGGAGGTVTGSSATGSGGAGQGGATGACTTCDGACVDVQNDALHCGACDVACPPKQHCDHGACRTPLCLVQGPICPGDHVCCGDACCPPWKMCCNTPDGGPPSCVPVDAGACPTTCAACP